MNIYTIHNSAASGGSICSQVVAASTNSVLVSEIAPLGWQLHPQAHKRQRLHGGFRPGNPLAHALLSSGKDLSNRLKLKSFAAQLLVSIEHANDQNMNILLREHTHSAWAFGRKNQHIHLLEFLRDDSNWKPQGVALNLARPVLTVRHPLDNYLSAREKGWHSRYSLDHSFDGYCKSLYSLQANLVQNWNAIVLRYEDLCLSCLGFVETLSGLLGAEGVVSAPSIVDINKVSVTGKSGRKTQDISLRPRQADLIDVELSEHVSASEWYTKLCDVNGYNSELDGFPLVSKPSY